MASAKVYNYLVVGGGLLGSSVAYHISRLAKRSGISLSVCLLERGSRLDYATCGNTQFSSGLITSSHSTTLGNALVEQTFKDLDDLVVLGFNPNFHRVGCVDVSLGDKASHGDNPMRVSRSLANVLNFNDWESVFADVNGSVQFDDFCVSKQFHRDGYVSPTDLADAYRNAALSLNPELEVRFDANVMDAKGDAQLAELVTSDGSIVLGETVVNATGAWVDELADPGEFKVANGPCVPMGLLRADYWMLRAPCQIPESTPLITLPGAYLKPNGGVVDIGTYRDEQLLYVTCSFAPPYFPAHIPFVASQVRSSR